MVVHYSCDRYLPAFGITIIFPQKYCSAMLHNSELLLSVPTTIKNTSTTPDNSKELSKSSVSCQSQPQDQSLQGQIVQLKEKAHQSFMQVIQMQQLHEEELELLREEFAEKERDYQLKIAEYQDRLKHTDGLEVKVKQLEYENHTLEKNYKHHICDFDQDELEIDNIQMITCQEESRLDESAIVNFQEIISLNKQAEEMALIQDQIKRIIKEILPEKGEHSLLNKLIGKIFDYITFLNGEFVKVQEKHMEREKELRENKENQSSKFYESLQKESKFMAEHIKRLSAEKMKVEKKLVETERQVKSLEERLKRMELSLGKRGIKLQEGRHRSPNGFLQEHQKSLEINEFIHENFKNSQTSNHVHRTSYGLGKKNKL